MYTTLFFDLDGTLTDSKEGILNTLQYTLDHYDIEETDASVLLSFIGPPLHESFKKHYGFSESQCDEALAIYRDHYRAIGVYQNDPYPGAESLLREARQQGYRIVLATAKGDWTANKVVDHFGFRSYFDAVFASDFAVRRQYKHQILEFALHQLQIENPRECLMIGDREGDILGARQNGMDSIGVTYGYGAREEIYHANPTYIADSFAEIANILRRARGGTPKSQ